jgi:hypothetical protein
MEKDFTMTKATNQTQTTDQTDTTDEIQATGNIKQHAMPQTPDEYEQYLVRKFSQIINSPQFAVYDGFLEDYYRIPKESDQFPGRVLPMRKDAAVESGGADGCSNEKSLATRAAGVPSRSEGAAARAMPSTTMLTTTLSPITNRGATLYHDQSQSCQPLRTSRKSQPASTNAPHPKITSETPVNKSFDNLPCPHIMGGYDGGVELGFDGQWPDKTFERIITTLEAGRVASQQKNNDARFITLGDRRFLVQPYGGGKSVNYRYIIEGDGIKFYFHHKPDGGIQPVRLRYGFESLIGCNLFRVHDDTRHWLNRLGFVIEKETLSRVDMQVQSAEIRTQSAERREG